MMNKKTHWRFLFFSSVLLVIFVAACSKKAKDFKSMSPKEIMSQYLLARNDKDAETLRQIIYFSPEMSNAEIDKKVQTAIASADEKATLGMFGVKTKVEYEKIIGPTTAEVGVIMDATIGRRTPFMQVVLKKDNGIWKYHYSKSDLTDDQLQKMIKLTPPDADAFFLLGRKMVASNPKRAARYYLKYKELAPNGFWSSESMNEYIRNNATVDPYAEEKRVQPLWSTDSRDAFSMLGAYIAMAKIFWEAGVKDKTQEYINKCDELIKKYPKQFPADNYFVILYYKDKEKLEHEMKQGNSGNDFL